MRLDRLITLALHRLQRLKFSLQPSASSLPILMYHSISDDPERGVPAYYKTCTSPAVFRQHMQFLHSQGYKTLTLTDAVNLLGQESRNLNPNPDRPEPLKTTTLKPEINAADKSISAFSFQLSAFPKLVVLTFDDGFRDFYTSAFPILHEFGFTATVFLSTTFIADERRWFSPNTRPVRHSLGDGGGEVAGLSAINSQPSTTRECLTWAEVRELHSAGIEIGSHTVNHPRLVELSWKKIDGELRDSKTELEQQLGEPVRSFAYPYAFPQSDQLFANTFRSLLTASGYSCCATTEIGRASLRCPQFQLSGFSISAFDNYRLPRLPVNSCDDLPLFRAKLNGAYDWLATPQAMVKQCKSWAFGTRTRTGYATDPAAAPLPG